jgi:hypothetical protein
MGGNSIDLLNLYGEHTFDVRCFAWCDILSSMALARPTLLNYESNIRNVSHISGDCVDPDRGLEWIVGCPDVLVILLARTTALSHARVSVEEKISRGGEIEQFIRRSEFRPVRAKHSRLRVARLGAQEIWRHTALLYVHQVSIQKHNRMYMLICPRQYLSLMPTTLL